MGKNNNPFYQSILSELDKILIYTPTRDFLRIKENSDTGVKVYVYNEEGKRKEERDFSYREFFTSPHTTSAPNTCLRRIQPSSELGKILKLYEMTTFNDATVPDTNDEIMKLMSIQRRELRKYSQKFS